MDDSERTFDFFIKGRLPNTRRMPREAIKPPKKLVTGLFEGQQYNFEIISRETWGAEKPVFVEAFSALQADIVVTWTDTEDCDNVHDCSRSVRLIQQDHLDAGEHDIRYNFLIGGDGHVYEGRGWHVKPPPYEEFPEIAKCCVVIAHIGKRENFPSKGRANVAWELIDYAQNNNCTEEKVGVWLDYFDEEGEPSDEVVELLEKGWPESGTESEPEEVG